MSCLKNLKKCKGECCRYFIFNIEMTPDLRKYYNLHENTQVKGNSVIIRNKCKHLSKSGKCKIYDSKQKPKICSEGYTETMESVDCPKNCIYIK
jgi:hypothetical protein